MNRSSGWREGATCGLRLRISTLVTAPTVMAMLIAVGAGASSQAAAGVPLRPPAPSLRTATTSCSSAVASGKPLTVRTASVSLPAPPFGIAATADGKWSFVDEAGGNLAVLSNKKFRPRVVHMIATPPDALSNSLTPDGRYLLVANGGDGATVVNVRKAEAGGNAVLGTLSAPGDTGPGGAIEVTTSPDGRFAFVSVEYEARVAVYNLHAAIADHFSGSSYVGSIPTDKLTDGLAVSPDGRWLYVASEVAGSGPLGSLTVIRLATAERQPAQSVVASGPAGCNPVRVVPSADGRRLWVTARGGNQLLAFSAKKLRTDSAHSRRAAVRVGPAPIGIALVNGGREAVVADSNRFVAPTTPSTLTVVKTAAALAHRKAVLGTIPAGAFPREMALEPDHRTLLVGNYGSNELEAVDLRHLP